MKRFCGSYLPAFLAAAMVSLVSGCAGYQIGPVQPRFMEGIRTLAVPTFKNDTLHTRTEVLIASTVIKQIQQDGTFRIEAPDRADAILEGTISEVRRRPARSVRGNVLATREFNMELTLDYQIRRRDTGKVIWNRSVEGRTSFFVSGDVATDERQAIPLAAEDAAVRLVSQISEGW